MTSAIGLKPLIPNRSDDSAGAVPLAPHANTDRPPNNFDATMWGANAVLVASAFGNGLNYVFSVFLARALGPMEFGLYALGLTIFNTISLIMVFGMDTGVMKFVSEHLGRGEEAKARSVIAQVGLLTMCFGALGGVGLSILSGLLSTHVYHKPELESVLRVFAAAVPLVVLSAVLVVGLQAFRTVRYTIFIKYIWEPVGKFLLVGLCIWAGFGLSGVMGAILVTYLGSVIVGGTMLKRIAGVERANFLHPEMGSVSVILAFCLPLTLANIIGVLASRSDVIMLGYWIPIQHLAVYAAALQTSSALALIMGAIEVVLVPLIGRLWAVGELQQLQEIYKAVSRLALTGTMLLFAMIAVFAKEILSVFGPDFSAGAGVLVFLAFGQVFASSTGSAGNILLMSGQSRLVMWTAVGMGALLLVTTALLTPYWGMYGAALSVCLNLVGTNAVRVMQVWKLYGIHPYSGGLGKPLLAGLLTVGLMVGLKSFVGQAFTLLLILPTMASYAFFLFVLGIPEVDRSMFTASFTKVKQLILGNARSVKGTDEPRSS